MTVRLLRKLPKQIIILSLNILIFIATIGFFAEQSNAVGIEFFQNILERGYIKVGIPPYETPPYYYFDTESNQMEGIDILICISHCSDISVLGDFFNNLKLCKIVILKFVNQDMFEFVLKRFPDF